MRRLPALTVLALLISSWAVPAHATSDRLQLEDYEVIPVVQQDDEPTVRCDGANFFECGYVEVDAGFSGLADTPRPAAGDDPRVLNVGGTIQVKRTYGCERRDGRRLRALDEKVVETFGLNTRRGIPLTLPDPGEDQLRVQAFAFLPDAQPGPCPRGSEPRLYRLQVAKVRLQLESRWAPVPGATYRLPGRSTWTGSVPTPALSS